MPSQCVHCSKIYPDGSRELLEGCSCGSRFFFFVKEEQLKKLQFKPLVEWQGMDKKQMEQDVRELIGTEKEEMPVILDLESVKLTGPGKFEIDLVKLFDKKRPLVYKLDEGRYVIDLAATLRNSMEKDE
ncbi:MAG: Zn-ribbon containing protein [Nanoarchaeota archaeon]